MQYKYGNKKVEIDGIKFDSKKEAKRYTELKLMQHCGTIEKLELQKSFVLIPAQYMYIENKKKCVERAVTYKADFYYFDKLQNCWVCEDTKGFKTKDYIIKRKLMLFIHKVRIVEI